jgi:Fe-S-cluster containining protein
VAPTYGLTIHADFACRSTGACCTAGWPIHAEPATVGAVTTAVARHAFTVRGSAAAPKRLFDPPASPGGEAPVLLATNPDGSCAFFERDHGRLCAIHRQLGHEALPMACRQFPRVTLMDGRGSFVSLSHYCPTAARLLFRSDVHLAVERNPPAFPGAWCEGLDARDTLPPLLRRGVLHSLDSYTFWERFQVNVLADGRRSAESALAAIALAAEHARTWTPAQGSLEAHVARAADTALSAAVGHTPTGPIPGATALAHEVWASIPAPFRAPSPVDDFTGAWNALVAVSWLDMARPVRHYLAARAFASWIAYQGGGVRTAVHALRAALALLQVECVRQCQRVGRPLDDAALLEAIRASDLALVHLAAPDVLTRRLARREDVPA